MKGGDSLLFFCLSLSSSSDLLSLRSSKSKSKISTYISILQVQEIKTKTWNQGLCLETLYCLRSGVCCSCMLLLFFWYYAISWLGVKYQLTDCLFMFSERELNQTCAGFSDHCVNGTTCDPDTNICTATRVSKCCLYAIPGVLSIPFLRLCPTLSRSPFASFSLFLFTCPYLFWHFVQLLQRLPSLAIHLFPERSVVYRGCRSQGPLWWGPSAT